MRQRRAIGIVVLGVVFVLLGTILQIIPMGERVWKNLGIIYLLVGGVVIGVERFTGRKHLSPSVATVTAIVGIVAIVTIGVVTVHEGRPDLRFTSGTLWSVVWFSPAVLVPFVSTLALPASVSSNHRNRLVITLLAVIPFVVSLLRHGMGGFGLLFNTLMYTSWLVVGIVAGIPIYLVTK